MAHTAENDAACTDPYAGVHVCQTHDCLKHWAVIPPGTGDTDA
jgi:hypothetical protein